VLDANVLLDKNLQRLPLGSKPNQLDAAETDQHAGYDGHGGGRLRLKPPQAVARSASRDPSTAVYHPQQLLLSGYSGAAKADSTSLPRFMVRF
jgi:hypothetical protein